MNSQASPNPKPTFEERLAFVLDELDADRAQAVRAALSADAAMKSETEAMALVVSALRLEASWRSHEALVERIRSLFDVARPALPAGFTADVNTVIAEMVADTRDLQELAGYRGTLSAYQLSFEAQGVEVHLQISPLPGAEGERCVVQGELVHDGSHAGALVVFSPVGGSGTDVRTSTDETGYFKVILEPGTYALAARIGGATLLVPAVEVG